MFCGDLRCFFAKSVLSRFMHFCMKKNLARNCIGGEKMINMRYDQHTLQQTNIMLLEDDETISQNNKNYLSANTVFILRHAKLQSL